MLCQLESCGAGFEKRRPWQRYCSRTCKREAMSQRSGKRLAWLSAAQISLLAAVERAAQARAAELAATQSPAAGAMKANEEAKGAAQ